MTKTWKEVKDAITTISEGEKQMIERMAQAQSEGWMTETQAHWIMTGEELSEQ